MQTFQNIAHDAWCFTYYPSGNENKAPIHPSEVSKRIRYCVWQQELCPTTGNLHYQGYVQVYRKSKYTTIQKALGIANAKFLQQRGTSKQASDYCKDDKKVSDILTRMEYGTMIDIPPWKSKVNAKKDIIKRVKNGELEIRQFIDEYPEFMFDNYSKVDRWIEINTITLQKARYKREDYKISKSLDYWLKEGYKTRTLYLEGSSGLGKTQMMLSIFPRALKINDLDDAKDLRNEHTAIIYDDCDWKESSRPHTLSFIDSECLSKPKCRYHNAKIPASFPRIIITNEPDFRNFSDECLTKDNDDVKPEIGRRLCKILITSKLY